MVKILAVDTSGPIGILVLTDCVKYKDIRFSNTDRKRQNIASFTSRLLQDFGIEVKELTNLAVAIGPGRFIRTRVGIAFINGLAATYSLPITQIDSLAVLGNACVANLRKTGAVREETQNKLTAVYDLRESDDPLFDPSKPWRKPLMTISPMELELFSKEEVKVWAIDGDDVNVSLENKYGIDIAAAHVHCDAKVRSLIKLAEAGIKQNRYTKIAIPDYGILESNK